MTTQKFWGKNDTILFYEYNILKHRYVGLGIVN